MLKLVKGFLKEEEGMGTVEIVLIIAVLVAIAVGINAVFDINSWFELVGACIVIGIIGLVANMFALFNKSERHEFLGMIKRFAGKKGE